jgi:hypothetical protein
VTTKTYNTAVSVVELIEATSPEEAVTKLAQTLRDAGLEVLDDEANANAFESDVDLEGNPT